MLGELPGDLRYGARSLLRTPVFTGAAVLTLALGIGLNAAAFGAIQSMDGLPEVEDPAGLVQLYRSFPGMDYGANSIPHFLDVRERTEGVFDGVAAWSFVELSLSTGTSNEIVIGQMVSSGFFDVLGVEAALGRTFVPEEGEGLGEHPVVVLSHETWTTRFGADPGAIGRTIAVNGEPFQIVGVAPARFRGPMPMTDPVLWAPLTMQPQLEPAMAGRINARNSNFASMIARLAPEVSIQQARSALAGVSAGLRDEYPESYADIEILAVPQEDAGIHPMFADVQTGVSAVILIVAALLLLVACVNVANLFLARAENRRRELGIRKSIGAGGGRIARQLLAESLLLAAVSGTVSVVLAWWMLGQISGGPPMTAGIPIVTTFELGPAALVYTGAAVVVATLLFGLGPAIRGARVGASAAFEGSASSRPSGTIRLTQGLVVAQTALTLMLLVGAGLFLRNLDAASEVDVGFDPDGLFIADLNPGLQAYGEAEIQAFYREVAEELRARPAVTGAGWASHVPLGPRFQSTDILVAGYVPGPGESPDVAFNQVSPGYFELMGIPVRGRTFRESDDDRSIGVAVINQAMADRFWPGEDPIGRTFGRVFNPDLVTTVVGVVPTGRYQDLAESPTPYFYRPMAQAQSTRATLHVRAAGSAEPLAPLVREIVASLDPALPVSAERTMEAHLSLTPAVSTAWAAAISLTVFGVLGLLLSMVGVYGVSAFAVSRRTRELGIRIALGASPGRLMRGVLGSGLKLAGVGLVLGLLGGAGAALLVRDLLYSERTFDPLTFVGLPLVLLAVSLAASWGAARKANRVDPVVTLRAE